MDTIYQQIVEKYPKFAIEKQNSPSYIKIYTKKDSEVILVHVKNKPTISSTANTVGNVKNEIDELELTGSPLKLDLSLHTILDDTFVNDEPQLWTKDEALHASVDVEVARDITNLYNKYRDTITPQEAIPLWVLSNPTSQGKPLLLTTESNKDTFSRGIVSYEGALTLNDIDLEDLVEEYGVMEEGITSDMINTTVECKYIVAGISYGSHSSDELLNAPHGGATELRCEWPGRTLQTPFITCKVNLEQEVIIGHLASPCNAIWKSVTALHNINQLLVDMTAAGYTSVNLETAAIRNLTPGSKRINSTKRLNNLLNETETYAYTAECPAGGCICVSEDTTSLGKCLADLNCIGSSNDFTYKLWDVLRDCETAEELITLLIEALKFISSGKIRPFIDANNKTYLSKLVLKLSRGHSQAVKVLKNLRSSPPQALSLVAQVAVEKTMWEYTRIMSLLEHSFFIAGIWNTDARNHKHGLVAQVAVEKTMWEYIRIMSLLEHSFFIAGIWNADARTHESIEQINQTIQDMTMSGGDFNLNPFESLTSAENSIRLDSESFYDDDPNELTVDDFASLKKHGLVAEKKDVNEVPLITDEIDISPWKNLLMKFAQVHVCLEHLFRAETCLRADFASLKPISTRLLEYYVSEKSPIKTVGQLVSDPVQKVVMPIANIVVQDHLKKQAFCYRVEMSKKENASDKGIKRDTKVVYVFSQQPVFPPPVWQVLEPQAEDVAEVTTYGEDLKYYSTKYVSLSNKLPKKLPM